jgi:hypothetical protein
MVSSGEISSFRIGVKLIRIPVSVVLEYEKCGT